MDREELKLAIADGVADGVVELVSGLAELKGAVESLRESIELVAKEVKDGASTLSLAQPKPVLVTAQPEAASMPDPVFSEGDVIVGFFANEDPEQEGDWWPGKIVRVLDGYRYDVLFEDGEAMSGMGEGLIADPRDEDRMLKIEAGDVPIVPEIPVTSVHVSGNGTKATVSGGGATRSKRDMTKAERDEAKELHRKKLLSKLPLDKPTLETWPRQDICTLVKGMGSKNSTLAKKPLIAEALKVQKKYCKENGIKMK